MADALSPVEGFPFPASSGRFLLRARVQPITIRVALHPALVIASYSALALVMTWPLAAHLGAAAPGVGEDTPLFLWNIWWIKHSLVDAAGPLYRTNLLFHPQGTSLFLHGLTTLPSLLVLPAAALFSPVTALGVLALLNCTLNAATTYRLVHRLTGHPVAAWAAGCLFAYSPWAVGELQNHYNLYSLWPFVLFIDAFLQVLETPNRKTSIELGIVTALMAYTDLQFPVLALGPVGAEVWLCTFRRKSGRSASWKSMQAGLWSLLLAVVLSFPLLLGVLGEMNGVAQPPSGERLGVASGYSADVTDFLRPDLLRLGGRPVSPSGDNGHEVRGSASQFVQLGYVPLMLAAVGIIMGLSRRVTLRSRFGPQWWLGLSVLGLVLTLGPQLVVDGRPLDLWGIPILSPLGVLMASTPGINIERVPTRHMVTVTLALAVLGGIGIKWILQAGRKGQIAAGMVILAGLWELLPAPLPLDRFHPNPAYASLVGTGSVIDVPFSAQAGFGGIGIYRDAILSLGEQTEHGHPIVGGYVSRASEATLSLVTRDPFLRYLAGCEHAPPSTEAIRRTMNATGAAYVILHRDWPSEGLGPDGCKDRLSVEAVRTLLDASGFDTLVETSDVVIYTPHQSLTPEDDRAGIE